MDNYRRADFRLSIPFWVIVNENTHNVLGVPFGVALLQSAEHGPYFPIFTNEDLARTAIAAVGLTGVVPAAVAGRAPLRTYLDDFKRKGGEHVGLDATHPTRAGAWFWHVDAVLAGLARSSA